MSRGRAETAAVVEWFSGHRALERPVRLRLGGRVLELAVESAWVEGPPSGGKELIRVFVVRDSGGRIFRISARDDERVAVEVEETG